MRGHVRKRGSAWAIVVELDADPVSGRRRQKWVSGFRTKAIAERELRTRLRLIDEGEDAFPEEISVEAFVLERWLPHLETQGRLRAGTIRNYRQLMRDHILPRLGPMQLRKVRPGHVQAVLDEMTRKGRAGRHRFARPGRNVFGVHGRGPVATRGHQSGPSVGGAGEEGSRFARADSGRARHAHERRPRDDLGGAGHARGDYRCAARRDRRFAVGERGSRAGPDPDRRGTPAGQR